MTINYRVPMTLGQALARAANATVGVALLYTRQLHNAIKHRRHIAVLDEQDERLLVDIGLTRDDLRDALRQPIWYDPTELLARRAAAARSSRAASVFKAWLSIDSRNCRALAELDNGQMHDLSDPGRQLRGAARQRMRAYDLARHQRGF